MLRLLLRRRFVVNLFAYKLVMAVLAGRIFDTLTLDNRGMSRLLLQLRCYFA